MKTKSITFFITLLLATTRTYAQSNEIIDLLHDFEAKATAGTPRSPEEAGPAFERVAQTSNESIIQALPTVLQETASSYVSVRRTSIAFLFAISVRPDGLALLSPHVSPFPALLVDPDIPIRRMTVLIVNNLHLSSNSPLLPSLRDYLSREDAVATIGAAVAGLLMEAAPNDATSTSAVLRYMQRKDQNSMSRNDLLQSVRVARSHNRDIGKVVASYADDPNEDTSIQAIQTLQVMGAEVTKDNQQLLAKISSDKGRRPDVRSAAAKAELTSH